MPNSSELTAARLPSSYRVIAQGPQPGHTPEQVTQRLAALFRRSGEQMRALLTAPRAIIKKQVDYASALRYREALESCGCVCVIEAEAPDFSALVLQRFASPGIGIVLNAPEAWRASSEGHVYHLFDLDHGSQFSAIGVPNSSLTVQDWSELRVRKVAEEMPWLKQVKRPYKLEGENWGGHTQGLAAEYRGTFPGKDEPSHYLLLSLWTRRALSCLTITAPAAAFDADDALYRWLLQTQLSVQETPPGPVRDEAMARWLKYNKLPVPANTARMQA
ncbi:hypothetical protein LJR289_003192 [Pseudoduganella sp. LjRoot289]|uniref:hypothetical protein n=1 Tax=Pseudoduganella sp. LjRoot289 TaxID=3342314 RepID=UPI003ECF30FF